MEEAGKNLIIVGVVLLILCGLFLFGGKIPYFGKLPGDIAVEKENFRFYFPLSTSIVISILLSLVFWLLAHFRK